MTSRVQGEKEEGGERVKEKHGGLCHSQATGSPKVLSFYAEL